MTFSQVVLKSDVGEFQDGIFVAAEASKENPHQPPNRHKAYHQSNVHYGAQGDIYVSKERTSPSRSPHRRHSPNSQAGFVDNHANASLSPPKPRKPSVERTVSDRGGSPPKDKSPAPSRWAGPAFSNAPPPSSLPLPDFPPFQSSPPSSFSPSPSSSPSSSPPPTQYLHPASQPVMYPEYFYPQLGYPSLPAAYPTAYFSSYAYVPPQVPIEAQLSMDLRRMLHIEQPVTPILA